MASKHTLTAEEVLWCKELKAALRGQGVPLPDSDFLLAQFAIISKGKTNEAVQRVQKYQSVVVGEYGYSTETAMQQAQGFLNKKWPSLVLPSKFVIDGHPTTCWDYAQFLPSKMQGESEWIALIQEWLLTMDASCADLDEVRAGATFVGLCRGLGWKNFNLEMEKRAAVIYQDSYPLRYHQFYMVDAGPILTAMMNICKVCTGRAARPRL